MRVSVLVLIWIASLLRTSSAQEDDCLLASNGNRALPRFVRGGGDDDDDDNENNGLGINPIQAIITSYQFSCCGVVTEWRALVESSGIIPFIQQPYDITFQVWRPNSPSPVDTDGCYTMVGANTFLSIPLADPSTADRGIVTGRPPESERIEVRLGDVVGFYFFSRRGSNDGITFAGEDFASQRMWYGSGESTGAPNCPFPVGSQHQLSRSTNLAPLITATISQMACSMSSTTVSVQTSVVPEPTPIPITTQQPPPLQSESSNKPASLPTPSSTRTTTTQPSTPTPQSVDSSNSPPLPDTPSTPTTTQAPTPLQSDGNGDNTGLILGIVMALVVIVALVVLTIAIMLIVAKKKRGMQRTINHKRQCESVKRILTLDKESLGRLTDVAHSEEHIYDNPKALNQDYYFSEGLAEAVDINMTTNDSYDVTPESF